MKTVTKIRELEEYHAEGYLWKLSSPVKFLTRDRQERWTVYVITSDTTNSPLTTSHNVYIFPANSEGKEFNWAWIEKGSNVKEALERLGYTIEEATNIEGR